MSSHLLRLLVPDDLPKVGPALAASVPSLSASVCHSTASISVEGTFNDAALAAWALDRAGVPSILFPCRDDEEIAAVTSAFVRSYVAAALQRQSLFEALPHLKAILASLDAGNDSIQGSAKFLADYTASLDDDILLATIASTN